MRPVDIPESQTCGSLTGRRRLRDRPWLLTTTLATVLCAGYLIAALAAWRDAPDRSLYANLGMIPIGLTATILALSASTSQKNWRPRWAWRLVGAGLGCFWAGDVLFFFYQNVLGISPFPSPADAGYLAYYPLIFAGLLCLPGRPSSRRRKVAVYVACSLVVALGTIAVFYLFLLPALQSSSGSLLADGLAVGYPLGDIILLAGITGVLVRRSSANPLSSSLLTAGLAIGLVADVAYGYQSFQGTVQPGGFSDAAYMVSWALFAWAGYAEIAQAADAAADTGRAASADEH